MFIRTSATNCVRIYNNTLSKNNIPPPDWPFGFKLKTDHIWDSFIILSLLEDSHARQESLEVPHTGAQKDRFTPTIKARNLRFRLYSQPELRHYCNKCVRFYHGPNKKVTHMVYVVVIDGITVGHPCCAIHNCHVPLANNRHRFCPEDAPLHDTICSIVGCSDPVLHGRLTCGKAEHQEVERIHRERGQARFQLQERLQCAHVAHPENASADERDLSELVDMDESEEEFEVEMQHNSKEPVGTSSRPIPCKKICAQFGRKRTHNEQIIVAPCGIIIARETFYGAEGVASVVVRHISFLLVVRIDSPT